MNFLATRLEDATGYKLNIISIFEFIKELGHNASQDSKDRIKDFQYRWKDYEYAENLKLAYISGSWLPASISDSREVVSQKSWEDYLRTVDFQFSSCSCPMNQICSPVSCPDHLVRKFWKAVYDCCGGRTVTFIVEKSLIALKKENGFYILLAAEKNTLYQKILRFNATPKRFQNIPNIPTSQQRKHFNPYQLECGSASGSNNGSCKMQVNNDNKCLENKSGSSNSVANKDRNIPLGKRKLSEVEQDLPLDDQFCKKVKISTNPPKPDSQNISHFCPSTGLIRWLKTTPTILAKLMEEREKMKQKYQPNSITPSSGASLPPTSIPIDTKDHLNYVGIYNDNFFDKMSQNNINCVLKQSKRMKFPGGQLPQQWKGLKIIVADGPSPVQNSESNDSSASTASSKFVTAFQVSETFARQNNIRVKVKQRRGKNIKPRQNENAALEDPVEMTDQQMDQIGITGPSTSTLTSQFTHQKPQSNNMRIYDPLIPLETSSSLYNKSSWSRLPKSHILQLATTPASARNGHRILLEKILETPVGSNFDVEVLKLEFQDEIDPLLTLLKDVVTFHTRVKDIHQLIKKCLTGWIIKADTKRQKCQNLQEFRASRPRKMALKRKNINTSIRKKFAGSAESIFDLVDLTLDTPSTPSTTNPNSEPSMKSNSFPNFSILRDKSMSVTNLTLSAEKQLLMNSSHMSMKEQKTLACKKLKDVIPPSCVMNTLKQIFHLSKMNNILGSKKNVRGFFSFVRKSIILAGTKSSLHLGQLMSLLCPSGCEWLKPIQNESVRIALFAKVMKWIFTNYLISFLKASFYITEISNSRLHSCFYLRETWKSAIERQREHFIKFGNLHHVGRLSRNKDQQMNRNSIETINSRIRFVPKKNFQLRPIVSRRREKRSFADEKNGNMLLNHIIKEQHLYRFRDPHILRLRWMAFIKEWQSMDKPKLYYARVDIKDAYPSVDMTKLRSILEELVPVCDNAEIADIKIVTKSRTISRQIVTSKFQPWTSSVFNRPCLATLSKKSEMNHRPRNIFQKLLTNMQNNFVKIGKHKYNFDYGLPQGSVLSEALCNVYYGDLDKHHLSRFLNRNGEFFATSVDDYIYISPKASRISLFLKKMENGFNDYNCNINTSKILTNIYPLSNVTTPNHECEWLTFCGWSFCLSCCHVMRDFSYYAGHDMASTLSFIPRNATSPENFLIARMKVMLPARMNRHLLDPAINCKGRIVFNILEAGLIFAFRFVAVCRVVYPNSNALQEPQRARQSISAIAVCANTLSRLILGIIESANGSEIRPTCSGNSCQCVKSYHEAYFSHKSASRRAEDIKILNVCSNNNSDPLTLTTQEILYMIYHAFILKLSKHSSMFGKEVLPRLYKIKKNQQLLLTENVQQYLNTLLQNQMPKNFTAIKI